MEKVSFESQGLKVSGLLFTPEKPIATVVVCMGLGSTIENSKHWIDDCKKFEKNGFKTLIFDPLGLGESEGDFGSPKLSRDIKTLQAAINYLDEDVFVIGSSWGAMMASCTAPIDKRIKAIALNFPFTDIIHSPVLQDIEKFLETHDLYYYKDRTDNPIDREFIEDIKKYSGIENAKKINIPVLIVYGTEDKVVLPEGTKEFYENLKTEKQIIALEGEGHGGDLSDKGWKKAIDTSINWFKSITYL